MTLNVLTETRRHQTTLAQVSDQVFCCPRVIINSFKAQFQTAQCAMQLWNNTGAKILHAYMKLYNIQIYMKAKYNGRKYL